MANCGATGAQGPAGPAPSGTGFVKVIGGSLDTTAGIVTHKRSIASQTIPDGEAAIMVGPITIAGGVTLTIAGTGHLRII